MGVEETAEYQVKKWDRGHVECAQQRAKSGMEERREAGGQFGWGGSGGKPAEEGNRGREHRKTIERSPTC